MINIYMPRQSSRTFVQNSMIEFRKLMKMDFVICTPKYIATYKKGELVNTKFRDVWNCEGGDYGRNKT